MASTAAKQSTAASEGGAGSSGTTHTSTGSSPSRAPWAPANSRPSRLASPTSAQTPSPAYHQPPGCAPVGSTVDHSTRTPMYMQ
eukprot:7390264-Prymnesium_polylepis.1